MFNGSSVICSEVRAAGATGSTTYSLGPSGPPMLYILLVDRHLVPSFVITGDKTLTKLSFHVGLGLALSEGFPCLPVPSKDLRLRALTPRITIS